MIIERYYNTSRELSLCIEQSLVEAIRERDIKQLGVRVYSEGFIGIAGANGDFNEKEVIEKAIESLEYKVPYNGEPSKNNKEKVIANTTQIDKDNFINNSTAIINTLKREHPEYIFSGKINLVSKDVRIVNDADLDLHYIDQYVSTNIFFKHKTSTNLSDGALNFRGREFNTNEFMKYALDVLSAGDNSVELEQGKTYPVIFSTTSEFTFAYGFINTYFARDLHAQTMATGSSLLSGKMGEKVFNDSFTLYQSLNPTDISEPFFDTEGVVTSNKEYTFIKNGKIITPFTDKNSAIEYNLPLTGSSMGDFNGVPGLGTTDTAGVPSIKPYGLKIKETEKTLKQLLNGDVGIFVVFSLGGNYAADGNYVAAVQYALLFDGEKFIGRLPQIMVASNVFSMYGDGFRGVCRNEFMTSNQGGHMVVDMQVAKMG